MKLFSATLFKKLVWVNACGLVVVSLMCCTDRGEQVDISNILIDLDRVDSKEVIDDLIGRMEIKLIPFETNDSSLLSAGLLRLSMNDNAIFIGDQNAVFRFDRDGGYVSKFKRAGQGPEEYLRINGVSVQNEVISIIDYSSIVKYDLQGNFLKRHSFPEGNPFDITGMNDGRIYVKDNYLNEFMLYEFDEGGTIIGKYFRPDSMLHQMDLSQRPFFAMGKLGNGVFLTNYLDYGVYHVEDGNTNLLCRFNFGKYNVPDDIVTATTPKAAAKRMEMYRLGPHIMGMNNVTLNNEWITFRIGTMDMSYMLFYNRKDNRYFSSKSMEFPFSDLIGKYFRCLYVTEQGELCSILSHYDLKEMALTLSMQDSDYKTNYPFLKDIDIDAMDDDANPWLVQLKMK